MAASLTASAFFFKISDGIAASGGPESSRGAVSVTVVLRPFDAVRQSTLTKLC